MPALEHWNAEVVELDDVLPLAVSGGRGSSSAEQIFGLTSLWPQRPLQQKTILAYWAASPARGAALGYHGICKHMLSLATIILLNDNDIKL